jgi:hypothetical protein
VPGKVHLLAATWEAEWARSSSGEHDDLGEEEVDATTNGAYRASAPVRLSNSTVMPGVPLRAVPLAHSEPNRGAQLKPCSGTRPLGQHTVLVFLGKHTRDLPGRAAPFGEANARSLEE